jgi:hypothetical protein
LYELFVLEIVEVVDAEVCEPPPVFKKVSEASAGVVADSVVPTVNWTWIVAVFAGVLFSAIVTVAV